MQNVVYIDVLFVLNMFINYFILYAVAKTVRIVPSRLRIFFGALLGGLYSLFIFLPEVNVVLSLAAKLVFSISIVFTAFKRSSLKVFIKLLASFYIINFSFAGIMLGIWFAFKPPGIIINNGVVYFDISIVTLTISTIICYIIVIIISRLLKKNAPDNKYYELKITVDGKTAELNGIVDTGNSLCDNFTDKPVIIVDLNFVSQLFPENIMDFFKNHGGGMELLDNTGWRSRIRLIPYNAVGSNGLLPAFRPDCIELSSKKGEKFKTDEVIIAVSSGALPTNDFSALINPRLVY